MTTEEDRGGGEIGLVFLRLGPRLGVTLDPGLIFPEALVRLGLQVRHKGFLGIIQGIIYSAALVPRVEFTGDPSEVEPDIPSEGQTKESP